MKKDYPKEVIEAIRGGINSPFWIQGVKIILEDEIANLSVQILEDKKGDRLSDVERNHKIDVRLIVKNLKEVIEELAKPEEKKNDEGKEPGFLGKEYEQ